MSAPMRTLLTCFAGLLACGQTACNVVPYETYRMSQMQTYNLHQQYQTLAVQKEQSEQAAHNLASENEGLRSSLKIATRRVNNLKSGLSSAQERYISLLNNARTQQSPLSDSTTQRFRELDEKYPEFEFDPHTGVSKFHSDILFSSGSAQLNRNIAPLIEEFADIMNAEDASRLKILVVGHTDDKRIIKRSTSNQHPTNWHLSTNRANSVVLALTRYGIEEGRMGAAGYSMYQPVAPNTDEKARSLNRRVEIFVLAPDAVVAGWDPSHGDRR